MTATALDQRHQALAKANAVRVERAHELAKLAQLDYHAGCQRAAALVFWPSVALQGATAWQVIMRVRRIGRSKAGAMLKQADVFPTRRLGDLTPRQRQALAGLLARKGRR